MDDDEMAGSDRRNTPNPSPAQPEAPVTPVAAQKPAHAAVEQLRAMNCPQSASSTATSRHSLPPERPDPPTPRKALHGVAEESPAVVSRKEPSINSTRPLVPFSLSPQKTTTATPSSALFDLPQTLASKPATQVKVITPAVAPAVAQTVEVDHTPEVTTTAVAADLVMLEEAPQLQVPEVEDENVQRFFQQIMVHINTMQARQTVLVPTGIQQAVASAISPLHPVFPASTSVPPPTPVEPAFPGTPQIPQKSGDTSQFADADDDDTTSRATGTAGVHGKAKSRGSTISSRASMIPVRGAPLRASREAPARPAIRLQRDLVADKENANSGRPSVVGPRPMSLRQRHSAGFGSANQENVTVSGRTAYASGKRSILERHKPDGGKRVQIVLPPEPVRTLKKKKSFAGELASAFIYRFSLQLTEYQQ